MALNDFYMLWPLLVCVIIHFCSVFEEFVISRTENAIENLIWYSGSTIISLSCTSHQIYAYLSSSGCNFTKKTANFHDLFGWYSVNILTTTWKILRKLGQEQKTRHQNFKPVLSYLASISQKSTKLHGWYKKFSKKIYRF